MLKVEEGLKLVQNKFPERCYTVAFEFDKCFVYNSFDRSWDGNPDTAKVGRGPDAVNKETRRIDTLGSGDIFDSYGDFKGKIDLTEYLSSKDIQLINKVLKKNV